MNGKPVYRAGQGFETGAPPPRRLRRGWLAGLAATVAALAIVLWWRGSAPAGHSLEVVSTPAGARIWLDLAPTDLLTPATIHLKDDEIHRIQVRMPGLQAEPLLARVRSGDGRRRLEFQLLPLPAAGRMAVAGDSLPARPAPAALTRPEAPLPQVGVAPLLAGSLRMPEGVRERPQETGSLTLSGWDPAFRLRVDGRPTVPEAVRSLPPGSHRIQVDATGKLLLDTLLQGGLVHRLVLPGGGAFVELRIQPPQAEIVAADRVLGSGRVLLPRSLLPLPLRFPVLPGWLPPAPVELSAQAPARLEWRHVAEFSRAWPGGGIQPGERGYVMPGKPFKVDLERGARLEPGGVRLGQAFHDRRPGGAQTIRFTLELPREAHAGWPASLEIAAKDTGQRFPLLLTRGARLSVKLNGTALVREQALGLDLETRAWPVSNLLRPGVNEIQLECGQDARSAAWVQSIQLKVGT